MTEENQLTSVALRNSEHFGCVPTHVAVKDAEDALRLLGVSKKEFLTVLSTIGAKLVNRARRESVVPDEAEDVVQNALVYCLQRLKTYDPSKSSVRTWIYTVVNSRIRDFNKYYRKRRQHVIPLNVFRVRDREDNDDEFGSEDRRKELGHDPSYECELRLSVQQALAKLPPTERDIAEAVLMQGLTIAKYAAAKGVPLRTAERRLAKAKENLKNLLSEWRVL